MPPDRYDAALLWDRLRYALRVREMTDGKSFEGYLGEDILRYAVERCVSIIGEAASKVSEEFRVAHPEIEWRAIIAQRHRLVHEYGGVRHDLIWAVATEHIPELIRLMEPLMPPPPPDPEPEEDAA